MAWEYASMAFSYCFSIKSVFPLAFSSFACSGPDDTTAAVSDSELTAESGSFAVDFLRGCLFFFFLPAFAFPPALTSCSAAGWRDAR